MNPDDVFVISWSGLDISPQLESGEALHLSSQNVRVLVLSREGTLVPVTATHGLQVWHLMHSPVFITTIPQLFEHGLCLAPALTQGDLVDGRHIILIQLEPEDVEVLNHMARHA